MTTTFTQTELETAFTLMHDPADWKAPISAMVAGEGVNLACAAIRHFTATEPTVEMDATGDSILRFRITSIGYRAGPAGP